MRSRASRGGSPFFACCGRRSPQAFGCDGRGHRDVRRSAPDGTPAQRDSHHAGHRARLPRARPPLPARQLSGSALVLRPPRADRGRRAPGHVHPRRAATPGPRGARPDRRHGDEHQRLLSSHAGESGPRRRRADAPHDELGVLLLVEPLAASAHLCRHLHGLRGRGADRGAGAARVRLCIRDPRARRGRREHRQSRARALPARTGAETGRARGAVDASHVPARGGASSAVARPAGGHRPVAGRGVRVPAGHRVRPAAARGQPTRAAWPPRPSRSSDSSRSCSAPPCSTTTA